MNRVNKLYSAVWLDGHPFHTLAEDVEEVLFPSNLQDTNSILVVWGGSDINPDFYGHPHSRTTYPGGKRDVVEWALMKAASEKGIPIIGVCRGAQMLCALAGGYLLQDVKNHTGSHNINTINGDTYRVNSIHHQMMAGLEMTDHELLAWSGHNLSERSGYVWKDDQVWTPPNGWKEPEFVYFNKVKGFAIQWHPEMMQLDSPATEFVLKTIKEKLCLKQPSLALV